MRTIELYVEYHSQIDIFGSGIDYEFLTYEWSGLKGQTKRKRRRVDL